MAETLEIIIKATDRATKELKGISASMGSLRDLTKSAGIAVGIFTGVLTATGGAAIKAADGARDYILSMSDMALKAGTTVDEMSRIVQIGDDLRVSQESLATAFRFMSDKGIQPTLANLAGLSNEFLAIKDPVKRAQFAMETFGARGGLEMIKMLQVGGAALEEMGTKVDEFGLVVSEADRRTAQAYFNMQDNFSDMSEGIKKEVGTTVMPALIALMGGTMAAKGALDDWLSGDAYPPTLFRIAQAIAAAGKEWRNQQAALAGNVEEVGFLKNAIDRLTDKTVNITVITTELDGGYGSKYLPVGSGGHAGGYAGYVTGGGGGGARYGPRVEGAGGKFYKMDNETGQYVPAKYGLDMVVPPGYNENFGVRASSGEHVQVTPAGESPRGGVNIGTVNVNNGRDEQWLTQLLKRSVGM